MSLGAGVAWETWIVLQGEESVPGIPSAIVSIAVFVSMRQKYVSMLGVGLNRFVAGGDQSSGGAFHC